MTEPLIDSPLRLESLDASQAVFVGTAEEIKTARGIFGTETEFKYRFPYLAIGREVWEALGAPVNVMLKVEEVANGNR